MGSARAEDPLGKVPFFTKLAQDRPRKAQYSAGAVSQHSLWKEWWKVSFKKIH